MKATVKEWTSMEVYRDKVRGPFCIFWQPEVPSGRQKLGARITDGAVTGAREATHFMEIDPPVVAKD